MNGLTAVSLFAGIGGIDRALERAGISVVAAVEIDPDCRAILNRHFPETAIYSDVTEVTGDQLLAAGFVPERGLLAAGWPCQGNSVAGRRGGMDDPRSGLWRHAVRLMAETRPRWFLGENVPGLLSVNDGADIAVVRGDLAQLGYWWAERILDAQHFGVPQRRRRVFFVGCAADGWRPVQVLLEPESSDRDSSARGTAWPGTAAASDGGTIGTLQGGGRRGHRVDAESAAGGQLVALALTASQQRLDGTVETFAFAENQRGEVVTSAVSHQLTTGGGKPGQGYPAVVTHALTAEGADASEDGTGRGTPLVVAVAPAVRRLTPLECERLQGFPDHWTAGQSDSTRYRQLGNAVAVPCVEWITRRLVAVDHQTAEVAS